MEEQFFSWAGWDQYDTMCFGFDNILLKQKIGDFEVGTKFSHAVLNYDAGSLELYDNFDDEKGHKFKLSLNIGQLISSPEDNTVGE